MARSRPMRETLVDPMNVRIRVGLAALLLGVIAFAATARAEESAASEAGGGAAHEADAAEIGAKLSSPVSDVWDLRGDDVVADCAGLRSHSGGCHRGRTQTPLDSRGNGRRRVGPLIVEQ